RSAYSRSVSKTVARSGLARAREGKWVAGRPPYGYVVGLDGRLGLGDASHIEVVRWIFHRYTTTGDSMGDIAREVNRQGVVPPPSGRKRKKELWRRDTIHHVLRNRAYAGDIVWNVTPQGKHHCICNGEVKKVKGRRQRGGRGDNPATEHVVFPGAHPA